MNIYFDYQIFYLQKNGGISRYFLELSAALFNRGVNTVEIINPLIGNLQDQKQRVEMPGLFSKLPFSGIFEGVSPESKIRLTEFLTKYKCRRNNTVLHETYYTHRIRTRSPRVVTVHDMIYEFYGKGTAGEQEVILAKKRAIEQASAVIAVSENTGKELVQYYPSVKEKLHVIHHGVSQADIADVPAYRHHKPFILFIGNRGWYKNFRMLLDVCAADPEIRDNYEIICCGGGPADPLETKYISDLGLGDKVVFTSGDDEFVDSLYKSAACLAYISEHEGFGMPVLEAMRFGCPVLCSDESSLPEVAGDAALLVNVKDMHQVSSGLKKILCNQPLRTDLHERGINRAKQFSWDKCAERTSAVYKSLME